MGFIGKFYEEKEEEFSDWCDHPKTAIETTNGHESKRRQKFAQKFGFTGKVKRTQEIFFGFIRTAILNFSP